MNKRNARPPRGGRSSRGPGKPASGRGPQRSFGKPGRSRPGAPRGDEDRDERRPPRGDSGDRPARPQRSAGPRGPRREEGGSGDRPRRRPEGDRGAFDRNSDRPSRSNGPRGPRPGGQARRDDGPSDRPSRSSGPRGPRPGGQARRDDGPGDRPRRPSAGRSGGPGPRRDGPFERPGPRGPRHDDDRRPPRERYGRDEAPRSTRPEKPWKRQSKDERTFKEGDPLTRRPFRKGERSNRFSLPNPANEGLIRLNRYLANAGVGSRRQCDDFITSGAVKVNGVVVTELGTKVKPEDVVHFGEQRLSMEQKRYVLLNKPKDTITTTDDPDERHTVMDLIAKACPERLYPVGRLDRNTTGVLLLTNDGDLAKKLTHPSHGAEKIYHATLDKALTAHQLRELVDGIHLDDGLAQADEATFVENSNRKEIGLKLHMGRNRVVRRMFEALGTEVIKLDRVMFAGLTKKDLQRGHWRHLTEKEVTWLKQLKAAPKTTREERGGKRMRSKRGDE